MIPKLRSLRKPGRSSLIPVILAALFLVITACVQATATPAATPPATVAGADVANPLPSPTATQESATGVNLPEISTDFFPSADAVVAAQETVMSRIYQNLLPSVVHIRVSSSGSSRLGADDFTQGGEGSGFVWDDQIHIVTNHHVIQGADRVIVTFADRTEVEAQVLGSDPDSDLAVLELMEPVSGARAAVLADSDALAVGQMAIAIGNPFGQEFTMTSGIVSALGRTIRGSNSSFSIPEVIQTDAPINPGNSGGPLLDRQGHVMGVNTQIISRSGVSSGIGFAVPINIAKRVIPDLIDVGSYEYAWLGISGTSLRPEVAEIMDFSKDTRGALVLSVTRGGPADRAGLQGSDRTRTIDGQPVPLGGDTIMAIDGSPITDMNDLIVYLINNNRPGDTVTMDIISADGERLAREVTLGKRPASN